MVLPIYLARRRYPAFGVATKLAVEALNESARRELNTRSKPRARLSTTSRGRTLAHTADSLARRSLTGRIVKSAW